MVKSKNIKKQQSKHRTDDDVCPYASKEEEEEFLNFSDDSDIDSKNDEVSNEIENKIKSKKAFEVNVSDDEGSGLEDDNISDDEYDDEDGMDDPSDDQEPFDRKNSRDLSKFYTEQNERTVFVGNITPLVTPKVLIQLFNSKRAAGPEAVESVRIRGAVSSEETNNRNAKRRAVIQNKFKGDENQVLCAYVVLKKKEDVPKCIRLNNAEVNGRHIRVDIIRGKKMSYKASNSVFIGNLPYDCNEEQVREEFSKCGEIVNVRLVRSKLDGKTKGFGYVEFTESMGVDFSLKSKDGIKIGGRDIRVEKWSGDQTQQQKRKTGDNKGVKRKMDSVDKTKKDARSPIKRRKVVVPTNMRSLELNEYIKSKSRKMNKKIQKKKTFNKEKKAQAKKNNE